MITSRVSVLITLLFLAGLVAANAAQSPSQSISLQARHGDHGHEAQHEKVESMQHAAPTTTAAAAQHKHFNAHNLMTPTTGKPVQAAAGKLIPVPATKIDGGGHHHHSGHAPVLTQLNETALFHANGPTPLSYFEWDFAVGAARDVQLLRFIQNLTVGEETVWMGQVDGVWRILFDQKSQAKRQELEKELRSYIGSDGRAKRHGTLMILHIVGHIISCFVMLPIGELMRTSCNLDRSGLRLTKCTPSERNHVCSPRAESCALVSSAPGKLGLSGLARSIALLRDGLQAHFASFLSDKRAFRHRICSILDLRRGTGTGYF